jgi:hypothetical protein
MHDSFIHLHVPPCFICVPLKSERIICISFEIERSQSLVLQEAKLSFQYFGQFFY